jgi:hypothetical protein
MENHTIRLNILRYTGDGIRVWESIGENLKISAKENLGYNKLNKLELWFNKGCPKILN